MQSKTSKSIEKLTTLRNQAVHLGGLARTKVSHLGQAKLKGRGPVVGFAVATVVTAGFLAGTAALVNSAEAAATQTVAVADAQARQQAADRADRSSRTAAGQPAAGSPAAPAPAAAKAKPAAPKAAPAPAPKWVNPMASAKLSSCFGPRWGTQHQGIDFAAPTGTKIQAIGAGTVIGAGWNYTGYGISIMIDHGNGYFSHYAHASKALVKPGQKVKVGQAIALEGSTGDSTGPHLHFEIHKGMWNQIDPAKWLRTHAVKIGC